MDERDRGFYLALTQRASFRVGIPRDPVQAVSWYQKSAAQKYAIAQCNLGFCYETGCGMRVLLTFLICRLTAGVHRSPYGQEEGR